jgi:hypothetical protein
MAVAEEKFGAGEVVAGEWGVRAGVEEQIKKRREFELPPPVSFKQSAAC